MPIVVLNRRRRRSAPLVSALTFARVCRAVGLLEPVAEYAFARHIGRRWRFDYAWPDAKVALEVEGGIWHGGRHQRPDGFRRDLEKYNAATLDGWRVFRCEPDTLTATATLNLLRRALRPSPPAASD